jgi:hypothetical protein
MAPYRHIDPEGSHARTNDAHYGDTTPRAFAPGAEWEAGMGVKNGMLAGRSKKRKMFTLWQWELASTLTAVSLFVVMAVVLVRHNGQLQREWSFPLSPNSLVAVFSALIRLSILVPVAEGNCHSKSTLRGGAAIHCRRLTLILLVSSLEPAQVVLVPAQQAAVPSRDI